MFWLSFCDASRPEGEKFLGACLVSAGDVTAAAAEASARGINPGGEVLGVMVEPDSAKIIPATWMNRLLSREECGAFDKEMCALQDAMGDIERIDVDDLAKDFLCAAHNPENKGNP